MEYKERLRRETNKLQAKDQGIANAAQERENQEIRDRQLVLKEEQRRITTIEAVREAGKVVGDGVSDYLSDQKKMLATVGVVSALALGVYSMRAGASVMGKFVSSKVMQPPLVRETSRKSMVLNPLQALKSVFAGSGGESAVLDGMVLEVCRLCRCGSRVAPLVALGSPPSHRHIGVP
jgi:ATPase family AAA domain-containing protein 3A/B